MILYTIPGPVFFVDGYAEVQAAVEEVFRKDARVFPIEACRIAKTKFVAETFSHKPVVIAAVIAITSFARFASTAKANAGLETPTVDAQFVQLQGLFDGIFHIGQVA